MTGIRDGRRGALVFVRACQCFGEGPDLGSGH
jgi:hypothetical protein